MNRVEKLREYIDGVLLDMKDTAERRCAYVHLYGVAQYCGMIALKRGENVELALMAGMLHDLYAYKTMVSQNHAYNGAVLAKEILNELKLTSTEETDQIYSAIYNHSNKAAIHSNFDEILKDADVFQHNLYNIDFPVKDKEIVRYRNLLKEFGIDNDFRLAL